MPPTRDLAPESLFGSAYRALTAGVLMSLTIVAFQSMGVVTVLPRVAVELDGRSLFGWSISAFMLASILGTVLAGQLADRRGPALPYAVAAVVFAVGSIVAAGAPTWMVLLLGRLLQGAGTGAIMALTYVTISRAYPPALHARMLGLLSTAWVIPALIGPAASGLIADHLSWRLVFVLLLPILLLAVAVVLPGLRRLPPPASTEEADPGRLPLAVAVVVGFGTLLLALDQTTRPLLLVALAAVGGALALPALKRLFPPGTLRVRRGLPAGIVVRGLLAAGFLGAESFVPYGLIVIHELSAAQAGIALTAGSLTWTVGALLQSRLDRRDHGQGRRRRVAVGFVLVAVGLTVTAVGVLVVAMPIVVAVGGWAIAGLGIGTAYPIAATVVLGAAPAGEEGAISASLAMVETLTIGIVAGIGGAAVAFGLAHDWIDAVALAGTFGISILAAVAGIAVAQRLAGGAERPATLG